MKKNKLFNLVLDLDNTLLNTIPTSFVRLIPDSIKNHLYSISFIDNEGTQMTTFIRPQLLSFLYICSQLFNLSIWTFGTREYANIIVKKLIPSYIKFDHVLSRDETNEANRIYHRFKPLEYLYALDSKYNSSNTVIIDDLPDVYLSNRNNCISIKPFNVLNSTPIEVIKDQELYRVYKNILDKFKISI